MTHSSPQIMKNHFWEKINFCNAEEFTLHFLVVELSEHFPQWPQKRLETRRKDEKEKGVGGGCEGVGLGRGQRGCREEGRAHEAAKRLPRRARMKIVGGGRPQRQLLSSPTLVKTSDATTTLLVPISVYHSVWAWHYIGRI
jgi:hypothetical protein